MTLQSAIAGSGNTHATGVGVHRQSEGAYVAYAMPFKDGFGPGLEKVVRHTGACTLAGARRHDEDHIHERVGSSVLGGVPTSAPSAASEALSQLPSWRAALKGTSGLPPAISKHDVVVLMIGMNDDMSGLVASQQAHTRLVFGSGMGHCCVIHSGCAWLTNWHGGTAARLHG